MRRRLTFVIIVLATLIRAQTKEVPLLMLTDKFAKIQLDTMTMKVDLVHSIVNVDLTQQLTIKDLNTTSNGFFSFPIYANTTLYFLEITNGNQVFSLESKSMDNIRKQANALKRKGKDVDIKLQENPHEIKIEIPSINPNAKLRIKLKYIQDLLPLNKTYQYTIPNFFSQKAHETKTTKFYLDGTLINSVPIIESTIKPNFIQFKNESTTTKTFHYNSDSKLNTEPIQISYSLAGEQINTGLLTYEEGSCKYVLGTIEPPKIIAKDQLAPREYIFVMDISGSMQGFPIETSKQLVFKTLKDLQPTERFNILFFSGSSDFFSKQSVLATPQNIQNAIEMVENQTGKGATKLEEALREVYKYPPESDYNRVLVLVSDGRLSTSKSLYYDLKNHLKEAQYFCFGIGYELNRVTLQQIAQLSGTKPVLITDPDYAEQEMNQFFKLIRKPLLRNIQVSSKNMSMSETYPNVYNGFLSDESSTFITKDCSRTSEPQLILTGSNGDETFKESLAPIITQQNNKLTALKYYWAKQKIEHLLQEEERCGKICYTDGRYRNQIIKIGEELNIATPYTSFVQESYQENKDNTKVKTSLYKHEKPTIVFQNDFDSDFDSYPNTVDKCPFDKGIVKNEGCPKTAQENISHQVNKILEGIEFDFDSYQIKLEFYEKLAIAAQIISSQPNKKYIVEGHTDAAGTPEYNMELSINRAKAVVNYLHKKGVDLKQMKFRGKGDSELKHPECRPQEVCSDDKNFENRRVVFIPL